MTGGWAVGGRQARVWGAWERERAGELGFARRVAYSKRLGSGDRGEWIGASARERASEEKEAEAAAWLG